jgi:tetratricopeptide (TPR) repeat protein
MCAGFYIESGDARKAQEYYQQAVQAKRAALGPMHPSIVQSLLPLARLLRAQGKQSEASAILQQQLKFLEDNGQGSSSGVHASVSLRTNLSMTELHFCCL